MKRTLPTYWFQRCSNLSMIFVCFLFSFSCKKLLPIESETIGADSIFTQKLYEPFLGRNTYYTNNFFRGSTTYPAEFKLLNVRRRNGVLAPELTDVFPVSVWKNTYTGKEESIAEIEAKRVIEYHTILDINTYSGAVIFRGAAINSSLLRAQPDSGYLFDIEVLNSGGRRYYEGLRLMPRREVQFEPSIIFVPTGHPSYYGTGVELVDVKGDSLNAYLGSAKLVIQKTGFLELASKRKLTIRILDKNYRPINPSKFNKTNWAGLIHGFNMEKTDTSVSYDVAYPIPLIQLPTVYTNSEGRMAKARIAYSRTGYGGRREEPYINLEFAIYQPGNWEILIIFDTDNPKFTND